MTELGTQYSDGENWSLLRFSHNGSTLERWGQTRFLTNAGSSGSSSGGSSGGSSSGSSCPSESGSGAELRYKLTTSRNFRTGPDLSCGTNTTLSSGTQIVLSQREVNRDGFIWRRDTTLHNNGWVAVRRSDNSGNVLAAVCNLSEVSPVRDTNNTRYEITSHATIYDKPLTLSHSGCRADSLFSHSPGTIVTAVSFIDGYINIGNGLSLIHI